MAVRVTSLARRLLLKSISRPSNIRNYGIYEPDYLDSLKPKYPTYPKISIQIKGYDYSVLENYQKFLHNVATYMELDVSECWAIPPMTQQVQRFKPASATLESEYKLTTYERVIQISNLQSPYYPTLLRIAQAALPEGVTINAMEHTEDHDELRYVPDRDLLDLKKQLDDIGGPIEAKKRK